MALNYDNNADRWYDSDTGQFVDDDVIIEEMRRIQEATKIVLTALTNQLYNGDITLEQWQLSVASELKDAHVALSLFAIGGSDNIGNEEIERIEETLESENQYLNEFAIAIALGTVSVAMALGRINQYGIASQQSYWKEFSNKTRGLIDWQLNPAEHCPDCTSLADGSPYTSDTLPTVPGGGDTRCRGNCKCTLHRRGR